MSPTFATVLSAVITTCGVILVAFLTTRNNRKGTEATNALAKRQADLDERAVDRADFDSVMMQTNLLLGRATTEVADLRIKVDTLETEVVDLRQQVREGRAWRVQAVGYIRRLVATHPNPPEPPDGFDLDSD